MSDDRKPTISVTRGTRSDRTETSSQKTASGAFVPRPMDVASGVARGAKSLWWAGLGALSVAEEVSTEVFDALVEEGKSWEQARRERPPRTVERVEQMTEESVRAVEALEKRVRDEVHATLRRLGVPRRREVDALHEQIDALSETLDRLADAIDEGRDDARS